MVKTTLSPSITIKLLGGSIFPPGPHTMNILISCGSGVSVCCGLAVLAMLRSGVTLTLGASDSKPICTRELTFDVRSFFGSKVNTPCEIQYATIAMASTKKSTPRKTILYEACFFSVS